MGFFGKALLYALTRYLLVLSGSVAVLGGFEAIGMKSIPGEAIVQIVNLVAVVVGLLAFPYGSPALEEFRVYQVRFPHGVSAVAILLLAVVTHLKSGLLASLGSTGLSIVTCVVAVSAIVWYGLIRQFEQERSAQEAQYFRSSQYSETPW